MRLPLLNVFEVKTKQTHAIQLPAPMLPSFEPTTSTYELFLHHHHHRQAKPSHRFLLYFVARKELSCSIITNTGINQRFVFKWLKTHTIFYTPLL
jgi:hypothetical protein